MLGRRSNAQTGWLFANQGSRRVSRCFAQHAPELGKCGQDRGFSTSGERLQVVSPARAGQLARSSLGATCRSAVGTKRTWQTKQAKMIGSGTPFSHRRPSVKNTPQREPWRTITPTPKNDFGKPPMNFERTQSLSRPNTPSQSWGFRVSKIFDGLRVKVIDGFRFCREVLVASSLCCIFGMITRSGSIHQR